jgi:hypothetical protein
MFPSTWRRWIRTAVVLDRAEQMRRDTRSRPKIEGLELRLVPAFTGTTPQTLSLTENVAANSVVVAAFTTDTPSDIFTSTIDWGDGATTTGTVASSGTNSFSVSGTHTYAEDGSYAPSVSLSEAGTSPDAVTVTDTANVAENGFSLTPGPAFVATEGHAFTRTLATFQDPGSPDPASKFTATIDWGDGSTDVGTITGNSGNFTVTGTHTYTDEIDSGLFTVTVSEPDANFTVGPVTNSLTVFEGDVLVGTGLGLTITEGSSFSGAVATFTNTGFPSNTANDFTATIDWGDGTTTDVGTLSGGSGSDITVSGSHTYAADEASFSTTVVLKEDAPGTVVSFALGTATIVEGDFGTLIPATINATEGAQFDGAVASFTDPGNPSQVASDFFATIDWGDGFTSDGTVSGSTGGPFTISGSHMYADEGTFTVTATFSDDRPSTLTNVPIVSTAVVAEADMLAGGFGLPLFGAEGSSVSGAVAVFSDNGFFANTAGDFTATIDWGDGITDAGTVSGGDGFFTVSGSHTYADEGTFTTTVTLTDDAPGTASAQQTGVATVFESDALFGGGSIVSATEGNAFSGQVATFINIGYPGNPASDFTATIDWGDGTVDAGTVTGSDGFFSVSGTHTYADEGTFSTTITLTDDAPGTASATAAGIALVAEGDFVQTFSVNFNATEGAQFSGAVASFADPGNPSQVTSDFTATIDWGDGTTTAGTVSGSTGGPFTISGSHTYTDEGTFTVTAAFSDDPPSLLTNIQIQSTATVAEGDSLTGTGLTVAPVENLSFSGNVATFVDSNPSALPSDFTATIDWGDGTVTAGTVSGGSGSDFTVSGSDFTVSGSHTYAEDGTYITSVTLTDDAPGTASATATGAANVAENAFGLTAGPSITTTEGDTFSGVVATFQDPGSPDPASKFTATIDWGDGTTEAGTVTGSSGFFTVTGTHTYTDEVTGSFQVTVAEPDVNFTFGPVGGPLTVAEADALSGTPAISVAPTEGVQFSGAVAIFTDTGFTGNTASDFTATIDWGDGTITAGTVSGGSGLFTVSGSHTYADEEASLGYSVTLTDDSPGTASATVSSGLQVVDADTLAGNAMTFSVFENPSSFTGAVATFTNTGFPNNTAGDFTATIDWGDGTITPGTVSGGSGSDLTVSANHTYAEEGTYAVLVSLADDAPGTATATAASTAIVAESSLGITAVPVHTTEGVQFSGVLATAVDPGSPDPATDFTATIDWGDGTTNAATIAGSAGNYTISGTHTYSDEGSFTATVTIFENNNPTFTVSNGTPVTVDEADVLTAPAPASGSGPENDPSFQVTIPFTDTNTAAVPGDFTATIDWGDGTITAGTVSGGSGTLTVTGSHAYADEGMFGITVTLADDAPGTATATFHGTGTVTEADTLVGTGLSITPVEAPNGFTGAVATFSDAGYPNNNPADFSATIDWGDGTTDTGAAVTITGGLGSDFTVSGSHAYAEDGTYITLITLTDDSPGTATARGIATVKEASLSITSASIHTTEGVQFSGTLATATDPASPDPASEFVATIDWGDGSTTPGTVSGFAGSYTISGSHTYTDEGSFTAKVTFFETNDSAFTVSQDDPVTVGEGDVLSGRPSPISATEATSFSSQVATFNDSGYPGNTASDFTATIDWGDGTTDTGAAVTVTGGTGLFTVSGTHTYADEGNFTVKVTLADDAPGIATATATATASVAEADALSGSTVSITTTEGQTFTGALATFTDTNLSNTTSDFTATIDWGDGTTDTGAAVTVSGGDGNFTVSGNHIYADEGSFTVHVTLADDAPGTATATATGVANVAEADTLDAAFNQPSVTVAEGDGVTTLDVAVFANTSYPSNPASDFTASINWGDGTTTACTVTGDGAGNYTVSGTHAYADEGHLTASVTLSDDAPGTATVTVFNQVTVTEADALVPSGTTITGTEGFRFTGQVASFANTGNPTNPASDFTATIDWGDNTTSAGTVSGSGGTFAVTGDHVYTASGHFTVSVKLSDDTPGTATATATTTANIAEQLLAAGTGAGQQPMVNVYDAVSGNLIATFDAFAPAFLGGVTVAVGDVNGDGVPEIIVAAGPGGGPHVKVVDGTKLDQVDANGEIEDSALLGNFYAYDPHFNGGVFVAFGISEGTPEIITGAGPGGSPHVKVIDATKLSQLQDNSVIANSALVGQFYAYSPFFNGGVRVAAADLNGDQVLDIVTGAGPGGGPHVKAIDGDSLSDLDNNAEISNNALIGQFYAYTPTVAPSGGVYVAATDIGGNPVIITGDGSGADGAVDGPQVKVIDATKLELLDSHSEPTGAALLGKFFAYTPTFPGAVTVGADEINGDTAAEIITGAGPGGSPHVKVIDGNQLNKLQPNMEISDDALLDSFFAFDANFNGGVFIGAGT